jgi:hypothetical protein
MQLISVTLPHSQPRFIAIRASLLPPGRREAFQLLKPVLDEDHFGDGLGLPLFKLHHQESLSVRRDVPGADRTSRTVSRLLKQEARLAAGKTGPGLNIHDPDLARLSRPIKQLLAVRGPERLATALIGYLLLASAPGERLNIHFHPS